MILRIKYAYQFLIETAKENPVKTIMLILTLISFYFAGTFDNYQKKIRIEKEVKVDTGWVYLYKKISENKIQYELIQSDVPLRIENGYYSEMKYHGGNALLWVAFGFGIVFLIIGTFIEDGWEFNDVRERALANLVTCEFENDEYIYLISNRLIGKKKEQISRRRYICSELNIRSWSDVMLRPIYETKSKKRNNLLEELGIK